MTYNDPNKPSPEELEERRKTFNRWWMRHGAQAVSKLPSSQQGAIHDLMRRAFRAGIRFEAKQHEVIQLGGDW